MTAPDDFPPSGQATLGALTRQAVSRPSILLAFVLSSCAVRQERVGLLDADGERVWLGGYQGGRTALVLGGDSLPLRYLEGCTVVVTGSPTPAGFVVNDWHVTDAGDGSGGFVGELRAWGARLMVADRNTGGDLFIDADAVPELRQHVGKPVLLVGTVVGKGMVSVVAYRVLAEGGGADAP